MGQSHSFPDWNENTRLSDVLTKVEQSHLISLLEGDRFLSGELLLDLTASEIGQFASGAGALVKFNSGTVHRLTTLDALAKTEQQDYHTKLSVFVCYGFSHTRPITLRVLKLLKSFDEAMG